MRTSAISLAKQICSRASYGPILVTNRTHPLSNSILYHSKKVQTPNLAFSNSEFLLPPMFPQDEGVYQVEVSCDLETNFGVGAIKSNLEKFGPFQAAFHIQEPYAQDIDLQDRTNRILRCMENQKILIQSRTDGDKPCISKHFLIDLTDNDISCSHALYSTSLSHLPDQFKKLQDVSITHVHVGGLSLHSLSGAALCDKVAQTLLRYAYFNSELPSTINWNTPEALDEPITQEEVVAKQS